MTPVPELSPTVARLHRRIGLGLRDDELDEVASLDPVAAAERLLAEGGAGDADPWGDTDYTVGPDDTGRNRRELVRGAIGSWVDGFVAARQPVTQWISWFWHGHLVSALSEVRNPQFMVDQMRLLRDAGRGRFGELLRSITVDPAMLLYLNGNESTGDAPNENYSRELLELFALGHGNYTEDDVVAGARALSGWTLRRESTSAVLVPRRHDDSAQRYLGASGVHDVDTVIAAIEGHPALPAFIAGKLAAEIVGPGASADVIERATAAFTASGLSVEVLVRALVAEVVAGVDGGEIVSPPLLWFVAARRITGAVPPLAEAAIQLQAAGQIPWFAPNVSGWPSGAAWNNAAALVARFGLAALIADHTPPDHATLTAADVPALGRALGVAGGWSPTTAAALEALPTAPDRLVLALTSPEFVNC